MNPKYQSFLYRNQMKCKKKMALFGTILLLPILAIFLITTSYVFSSNQKMEQNLLLLVDLDCLQRLQAKLPCQLPVRVAASSEVPREKPLFNANSLKLEFDIEEEESGKDFWLFRPVNSTTHSPGDGSRGHRGIRKVATIYAGQMSEHFRSFSDSLSVPSNIPAFLKAWQNGRYFECGDGNGQPLLKLSWMWPIIPPEFVSTLSQFTELLSHFQGTPFIFGGTLLGWRRDCAFIPHTTDVDLGILAEQFDENEPLFRALITSNTFEPQYLLGNQEHGVVLKFGVNGTRINLFVVYKNSKKSRDNSSYISGYRDPEMQVLHWVYPPIEAICCGQLYGHLLHLPCNYEAVIQVEYGPTWALDHPSTNYIWDKSAFNIEYGQILSAEEYDKLNTRIEPGQNQNETYVEAWLAQIAGGI